MRQSVIRAAIAAALGVALPSHAVRLDDDGLGQALIFPYYTVQSSDGDSYNTYLSVVNHTSQAKALRVRVREGRAAREVASFNLFLSPNDMWTGAIVPGATLSSAPQLITVDRSCTSPAFTGTPSALPFQNALYSGLNDDGNGTGLDRTREGFVEMIEMAGLTGTSAAAVTHLNSGSPANCAAVGGAATLQVQPPTGGLSGTETLINVANGLNFDLDAIALADLSTRAFYRPAGDPYPDFNAVEIDPVSVVAANRVAYRATWSRPVDAVSATLMRVSFIGEYVLDDGTASNTDLVATFPTRQFYVSPTSARRPFTLPSTWTPDCQAPSGNQNETFVTSNFNREEGVRVASGDCGFPECPPPLPSPTLCAATVVMDVTNGTPHTAIEPQTRVLGSLVHGYGFAGGTVLPAGFAHGWLRATFTSTGPTRDGLTSLADSTRMDLATGAITTGPQAYYGLPVLGFTARTFVNGTLTCSAGACQGNYGGAFPFQYLRVISP